MRLSGIPLQIYDSAFYMGNADLSFLSLQSSDGIVENVYAEARILLVNGNTIQISNSSFQTDDLSLQGIRVEVSDLQVLNGDLSISGTTGFFTHSNLTNTQFEVQVVQSFLVEQSQFV